MNPSLADPAERTLGAAEYLLGALELGVILVALGYAAVRIRRAMLVGWSGPPAWVADAVAATTLAVALGEALGTFGSFTDLGYLVGCVVTAALAALVASRVSDRRPAGPSVVPDAPPGPRYGLWVVGAVCAVVVAGWMIPTISGLTGGMDRADSLWYHMPLSLRFAETGSTGDLYFFDPIFFATFYPANTEILHALGILVLDRDFLSPVVNLGFLGLALLAGWSIGRPYGVAPQALTGAAVVLGAETMVDFQAGEALNDIAGVAFVLCAVALLVNTHSPAAARGHSPAAAPLRVRAAGVDDGSGGRWSLAGLAFAGAGAGLAAGTKLSFLAPVALLTLAVVIVVGRGRRTVATAAWSLPMLAAGGYWYLRNLVSVGNPIPYTGFGPLGLPAPERGFELRPGFSIAHYWNDTEIWSDWFAPYFAQELGPLWALILIGVVAGGVYAVWRGRDPMLRALGAVATLTAIAYVFTPLTAGGEEGEPIAFEWNVRYLAPAVAIGLALLPCLPAFRLTPRRRTLALAGLATLAVVTAVSIAQWGPEYANKTSAIALGAMLFGAFALGIIARSRGWIGPAAPRNARWVALAALAGTVAGGYLVQNYHLERRYENRSPELQIAESVRWARDVRDARIAISGVRGVFNQYAFSGADLSNHVQWLGIRGEDDAFLRIPTCERWRAEINAGDYDYVVTMYDPYDPGGLTDTKEALWTREDPHAREVLRDGPVGVFKIVAPLDPGACGDLPDLEPSELNGDSVNNDPLANQPPPGAGDLNSRRGRPLGMEPKGTAT